MGLIEEANRAHNQWLHEQQDKRRQEAKERQHKVDYYRPPEYWKRYADRLMEVVNK